VYAVTTSEDGYRNSILRPDGNFETPSTAFFQSRIPNIDEGLSSSGRPSAFALEPVEMIGDRRAIL